MYDEQQPAGVQKNPTAQEIAKRDAKTIDRLMGEGRLGGEEFRPGSWRLWNPGNTDLGMVEIYLSSGRLLQRGRMIDGKRGLREALKMIEVHNPTVDKRTGKR